MLTESKISIKSWTFSAAFFGRFAAAYCLALYSYDLVVSSDSDYIFLFNLEFSLLFIFTPWMTFWLLLQCHLQVLSGFKINTKSWKFYAAVFRRLAAAYRLAFYSNDLQVSSDSVLFFLIKPKKQPAVHFYTLNDC